MASTPVILLQKRSGNSSDRPNSATIQAGEAAMSFGASDPGLYFKDSAGSIRKFGSNHYGATAPNSSFVGSPGNSVGETWVDSSTSNYYLRVWTGAAWQKVGAGFADSASTATTATTALSANTALVANSAVVASGSLGCVLASGSLGSVLASGSLGSLVASGSLGSLLASGSLGSLLASGSLGSLLASGSLGSVRASGALGSVLASGSLGSLTASGSLGSVLASGSLGSILASGSLGSLVASGIAVVTSLPSAYTGGLVYLNAGASGLYVSANGGWILT
jgi:hypothetical protein